MEPLLEPIPKTEKRQFCVEMMKRLDIQRRNEYYCDVILEVGSGDDRARLKAHRIVLCAASPFFYNALNSDMKEKKEGVIRLQETSKAVMEKVLEYLYTGHVFMDEHSAFNLLEIADFLVIPSLKELSSDFISRSLSSSNCMMAYYYAVRYQCPILENVAKDFTFANFVHAAESDDFLNLNMKQVEEWISSDEIMINEEEEVFQLILKWMESNEMNKHQSFLQLFRQVRLVYVSRNYLFDVILPHPLVKDSKLCSDSVFDAMKGVSSGTEDCFFAQPPRTCLKEHEDAIVFRGETVTLCYLPSENTWHEMEDKLSKRRNFDAAMGACHGKLYIIGGNDKGHTAECYDPLINSWAPVKSFTVKTFNNAGVVCFQGHLYVIGGMAIDRATEELSSVLKYNPDTDLWQRVAPLSGARSYVCAVADGNSMYAIGGRCETKYLDLDIVEKYDPEANSWSRIASTCEKRAGAGGAIVNGKVYLFGGLISKRTMKLMEMYDPASDTWSRIYSTINIAPHGFSRAVSFKGKIFVFGYFRQGDSQTLERSLWVYDIHENEWELCSMCPLIRKELFIPVIAPLRILSEILDI